MGEVTSANASKKARSSAPAVAEQQDTMAERPNPPGRKARLSAASTEQKAAQPNAQRSEAASNNSLENRQVVSHKVNVNPRASLKSPGEVNALGRELESAKAVHKDVTHKVHVNPRRSLKSAGEVKALGRELELAKAVVWTGAGELIQLPWHTGIHSTVLCVDMWSGFGGTIMALLALGVRVIAVALETDKSCIEVASKNLQNLVHGGNVEDFDVHSLLPLLVKRNNSSCILIGGGSPCQGNSKCNNNRLSRGDERSHQPEWPARFAEQIRGLAPVTKKEIAVVSWFTPASRTQRVSGSTQQDSVTFGGTDASGETSTTRSSTMWIGRYQQTMYSPKRTTSTSSLTLARSQYRVLCG